MSFLNWSDIIGNFSQVLLIAVGGLVFRQIKVAKDDLKIRCQRESILLSMDLAKNFAKEILPAIDNFNLILKEKNFILQGLGLENFYSEDLEKLDQTKKQEFQNQLNFFQNNRDILAKNISILNLFEAFSMNFMKQVADEDVVFSALAFEYCKFVESSFVYLCTVRAKNGFNLFENTINLYKIWSERIKNHGISQQYKSLTEKIKEISEEKKLRPLGT